MKNCKVLICDDHNKGFKKYSELIRKHKLISKDYDVMIVGFPGYVIMPLAKMICRKKTIFDAFFTVYDAEIISRNRFRKFHWRYWYIKTVDYLSVKLADYVLVESELQKKYFIKKFKIKENKIDFIYTGVDEEKFVYRKTEKFENFTVLFRGRLMPEAGVNYIINAAKLLEEKNIDFLIIGYGFMEKEVKAEIEKLSSRNVKLISEDIATEAMVETMLKSHVSLGQFGDNERLSRTIPHKAYESLALKLPYITGRASGISELLVDGASCLMVNLADPEDLADKILKLKNDSTLAEKIANNGYEVYQKKFTTEKLSDKLVKIIYEVIEKN